MKTKRAKLSPKELNKAAIKLASVAEQFPAIWQAKKVLSYQPFQGEISPERLLSMITDCVIYLPRIVDYKNGIMEFLPASNQLSKNRFGIHEPHQGKSCAAAEMDLILVPLTAFDNNANRLGMGAGFYDRALSSIDSRLNSTTGSTSGNRPICVGLAHHFQKITTIPIDPWDVALDAIISDQECILAAEKANTQWR